MSSPRQRRSKSTKAKLFPSSFPVIFQELGGDDPNPKEFQFVDGTKGFLFQDSSLFPGSKVNETSVAIADLTF